MLWQQSSCIKRKINTPNYTIGLCFGKNLAIRYIYGCKLIFCDMLRFFSDYGKTHNKKNTLQYASNLSKKVNLLWKSEQWGLHVTSHITSFCAVWAKELIIAYISKKKKRSKIKVLAGFLNKEKNKKLNSLSKNRYSFTKYNTAILHWYFLTAFYPKQFKPQAD